MEQVLRGGQFILNGHTIQNNLFNEIKINYFRFLKKMDMAKTPVEEFDSSAINLLGAGTTINGDIVSNGDIRINGILNGNLTTKGRLIVGETGKIKGEVTCKNADILGNIEGKISVSDLLSLKATSNISGEIFVGRIAIEPGCKFNGTCKMLDSNVANVAEKKIS